MTHSDGIPDGDGAPGGHSFDAIVAGARSFSQERGWTPVQTPKNLAMALAGEAGELLAELQWLGSSESAALVRDDPALRERVAMEMADVLIYLARLADVTGIDLLTAAQEKLARNHERFPVGTFPRLRNERPTTERP